MPALIQRPINNILMAQPPALSSKLSLPS